MYSFLDTSSRLRSPTPTSLTASRGCSLATADGAGPVCTESAFNSPYFSQMASSRASEIPNPLFGRLYHIYGLDCSMVSSYVIARFYIFYILQLNPRLKLEVARMNCLVWARTKVELCYLPQILVAQSVELM